MKTVVVYDSEFGNTAKIARAIAIQLERCGPIKLVPIGGEASIDLTNVDLLVVGGPTQAFNARPVLRQWVDDVSAARLQGVAVATFDTRVRWPSFLSGSAAYRIDQKFERKGVRRALPPESFFVTGREGPLAPGEIERAAVWAAMLAARVAASPEFAVPAVVGA